MENEQWRPVVGWEEFYEVSNSGNIRSVERIVTTYGGRCRTVRSKILVQGRTQMGYCHVHLSGGGQVATLTVHRIVAMTYLGVQPPGATINHRDGCKTNNAVSNLEYCSQRENNVHALRNRLRENPKGSKNGVAKLTEEDVSNIKRRLSFGESQVSIARTIGVSHSLINQIALKRIWIHVPDPQPTGE